MSNLLFKLRYESWFVVGDIVLEGQGARVALDAPIQHLGVLWQNGSFVPLGSQRRVLTL